MSAYYDFTQAEDLREFIMDILDGYVPTQLNDFPKTIVREAIDNLIFEKCSLHHTTGNRLYAECVGVTNLELNISVKEAVSELLSDNDSLTQHETELLESSLRDFEEGGQWEILDYIANGSLDSRIYINAYSDDLSKKQIETLRIINEKTDAIQNVLDNLNCDVENLEALEMDEELVHEPENEGR